MAEDYREGDTPEASKEMPVTAFMVVSFPDGRLEAITKFDGFDVSRKATIRDIRDLSHAMYEDSKMMLIAEASGTTLGRKLGEAVKQDVQRRLVDRAMRKP